MPEGMHGMRPEMCTGHGSATRPDDDPESPPWSRGRSTGVAPNPQDTGRPRAGPPCLSALRCRDRVDQLVPTDTPLIGTVSIDAVPISTVLSTAVPISTVLSTAVRISTVLNSAVPDRSVPDQLEWQIGAVVRECRGADAAGQRTRTEVPRSPVTARNGAVPVNGVVPANGAVPVDGLPRCVVMAVIIMDSRPLSVSY